MEVHYIPAVAQQIFQRIAHFVFIENERVVLLVAPVVQLLCFNQLTHIDVAQSDGKKREGGEGMSSLGSWPYRPPSVPGYFVRAATISAVVVLPVPGVPVIRMFGSLIGVVAAVFTAAAEAALRLAAAAGALESAATFCCSLVFWFAAILGENHMEAQGGAVRGCRRRGV